MWRIYSNLDPHGAKIWAVLHVYRSSIDTGNKAFVQFNENSHNCVWICNIFTWNGNKIKKKLFPTYLPYFFFHNISGNTTFFCMALEDMSKPWYLLSIGYVLSLDFQNKYQRPSSRSQSQNFWYPNEGLVTMNTVWNTRLLVHTIQMIYNQKISKSKPKANVK